MTDASMSSVRDRLLKHVIEGQLTPEQAEAEAARLGLPPLAHKPDAEAFDPLRERWWTLPMAVAWIAFRSLDAVRDCWPDYRQQCMHWLYRDAWKTGRASGFRLVPFEPASIAFLEITERQDDRTARDPDFSMPVLDAANALTMALRERNFEATGINPASGARETIPPGWWINRSIADLGDRADFPEAPEGSVGFREILVPMRALCMMWVTRSDASRTAQLPPLMLPEGGGYMPLFCAAQWIATEGGTIDFDSGDVDRWQPAFENLLARIASDEVHAVGFRNGQNEPLPGYLFAGIRIDYPFDETPLDLMMSDEMYLQSYPFTDEDRWRKGFSDGLTRRRGETWSRLMVLKADIARIWPFELGQESETTVTTLYRTGAPGRPTAMHLVEAEFQRRCNAGETEPSLTKESETLASWLRSKHKEAPRLTPKSIANRIRVAYRARRKA